MLQRLLEKFRQINEPADQADDTVEGRDHAAEARPEAVDRTSAQRLLPPFSGMLQVASTADARALSLDGRQWEIQFDFAADYDSDQQRDRKFTAVASQVDGELSRYTLPAHVDSDSVGAAIDRIIELIRETALPFATEDRFEYWLLDQQERKPLALLATAASLEDTGRPDLRPTWQAMPSSQLPVRPDETDEDTYVAPVNARLETAVADRAGPSPRAVWIDRSDDSGLELPPCLLREDWPDAEQQRLCELYLRRLAPRLLMLQHLEDDVRASLEQASRENATDVEKYHRLYPKIIDQALIDTLRVEARLRRNA